VYVFHFWVELVHLIEAAFGNQDALKLIYQASGQKADVRAHPPDRNHDHAGGAGLIDVVMISNLLIMVIVGGYETFVSRMNLDGHPDQPEWLDHVNASVLKVKLATAIIGISSIHLLKTFINAANYSDKVLIAQTVIHVGLPVLGHGHCHDGQAAAPGHAHRRPLTGGRFAHRVRLNPGAALRRRLRPQADARPSTRHAGAAPPWPSGWPIRVRSRTGTSVISSSWTSGSPRKASPATCWPAAHRPRPAWWPWSAHADA
jgi:hypothetical protein